LNDKRTIICRLRCTTETYIYKWPGNRRKKKEEIDRAVNGRARTDFGLTEIILHIQKPGAHRSAGKERKRDISEETEDAKIEELTKPVGDQPVPANLF
jgi:hypothetical protein